MLHVTCYKLRVRQHGFSLVELLVVLGLFVSVLTILGQIFSSITQLQKRIAVRQKLIQEARHVLDVLVDEVRGGRIDYAAYGAVSLEAPPPGLPLRLRGRDGNTLQFASDTACPTLESTPCVVITRGSGSPIAMTGPGVRVSDLRFLIDPPRDPFALNPSLGYQTNIQPRVTIFLTLDVAEPGLRNRFPLRVQTTVTPRAYLR